MRWWWAAACVVLLTAACSDNDDGGGSQEIILHPPTDVTSLGQPDHPIAGPQGAVPQFVVECDFSHTAPDDPIVAPGEPGQSHLHVFFGNTTTDAHSTIDSLMEGDTTCDQSADLAAYWAPALLRGPEVLRPVGSIAYYRPGIGVDPTTVQPYPHGLAMIAGNAGATEPQPLSIVAWGCGTGIERAVEPPQCGPDRTLRLHITFPDCWNGTDIDSPTHKAHVAYSSGGICPEGFPVPIPQLQFAAQYPAGSTDDVMLSSGGVLTGHADFVNAWQPDRLRTEVELCLHREVVCGIASGRVGG